MQIQQRKVRLDEGTRRKNAAAVEASEKAFTPEQLAKTKAFHLRGGIDFSRLSLVHKAMMAAMKKLIEKKPLAERGSDDAGVLETCGKDVDFSDKAAIEPLVEYAQSCRAPA